MVQEHVRINSRATCKGYELLKPPGMTSICIFICFGVRIWSWECEGVLGRRRKCKQQWFVGSETLMFAVDLEQNLEVFHL